MEKMNHKNTETKAAVTEAAFPSLFDPADLYHFF